MTNGHGYRSLTPVNHGLTTGQPEKQICSLPDHDQIFFRVNFPNRNHDHYQTKNAQIFLLTTEQITDVTDQKKNATGQ
jgi:hypothetical protein